MIDWIYLLYLDYILSIMDEIVFIIMFTYIYVYITIPFLDKITETVYIKTLQFIDITKSNLDCRFIIFCIYLILPIIVFYLFTISSLNKINFYIKNNGKYSDVMLDCIKNHETELKDCVEDKFSKIRNDKRLYVKEQFIKLVKQHIENGEQND